MDPWSFGSNGKGLLFSDEMGLPVDDFARSRKALLEWEARPYYNFDNTAAESVEFMELGFTDITRKHFHNNQAVEVYGSEIGGSDYGKRVDSPTCMLTPHSSFGEPESGWEPSSSVMECNSQNSSLIDLKLGRVVDHHGADSKFSNGRSDLASGGSAMVAKRARTTSSCLRTPLCQVQGCNMDLSSSKNYHQRHKVCEAHSKTARVIVNGMEQRFCQQCSRFHLLVEFDNGKRSCRKRLAGHNERRRKPQLASFSGRPHKLFHSTQGTRLLATSVPQRSQFVFPNTYQGGTLYQDKYGEANQYMHMKLERESIFNPNGRLLANSFHLHDAASNVQELSGGSNSSCALSLLSTQSNGLSSYPAGIPMGSNSFYPGEHAYHVSDHISERPVVLINGEKYAGNGFYSSMTNPIDVEQVGSTTLSNANHANFEVHSKGNFYGSGFSNFNHPLSPEHGTTIDLLQLSSHLQRVEQQRSSMPVKQEYEDFSSFLATREA